LFKQVLPLLSRGWAEVGQLNPLQQESTPVDTEAEIIRSVPITQKTITRDLKDKHGAPLKLQDFLNNST